MQSIGTGISNLIQDLDGDAAKLFRIAQNNVRFKTAVRRAWSDNPDAAEYLLAHTNSLFFEEDTAPRKGADKDAKRFVLGVYLDESTARAELNARREKLQFAAAQEGLHVDDIRILPAQMGMKERHLYPESVEYVNTLLGFAAPRAKKERIDGDERARRIEDQSRLLEVLKRAFCTSFDDFEKAASILGKIEGASLDEAYFSKRAVHSYSSYWCNLYVAGRDLEGMRAIVDEYGETIMAHAKALKLYIRDIAVRTSPEPIVGERAFPRVGSPVPLASYDLSAAPTESARIAEEVRAKINKAN